MADLAPQRYGDVPVPITAAWSVEQVERQPRVVRWRCGGMGVLKFTSDGVSKPGIGKPLFKIIHADRARAVLDQDVCQICCRRLDPERIVMNSNTYLQGLPLISDGLPMHPACAAVAYDACIGLRNNHEAGRLRIYAVPKDGWTLAPKVLGMMPVPPGDPRTNALLAKHGKLYAGPDLQLRRFRSVTVADLRQMAREAAGAEAEGKKA